MRNHAHVNWTLPNEIGWDKVPVALLMDIREVLRGIRELVRTAAGDMESVRRTLNCRNFQRVPHRLERLSVATERIAGMRDAAGKLKKRKRAARR